MGQVGKEAVQCLALEKQGERGQQSVGRSGTIGLLKSYASVACTK
jgi:hypothetical protein